MFRTISGLIAHDTDYPDRARRLTLYSKVLNGSFYDVLPYEFHEERTDSGDYIPLRKRRPSVQYGLARLVVEDSVAMLFSEGHFPTYESSDHTVRDALASFTREVGLNSIMIDAGLRGSVGSVALHFRVLKNRAFVDVLDTFHLTPCWDPAEPDTLTSVTEQFKVKGSVMIAAGVPVTDPSATYWFRRVWDTATERWFLPAATDGNPTFVEDADRSVYHGLGFVPLVWIRNLPGGIAPDGACTFQSAIDTGIEIDYQLSQAGRGLKYSSDPTLLIREPAGLDGTMVHGAANALVVSEKGDAKLLEIGGTASQAVIDYVRVLRDFALETLHGNRADAQRLTAPASGRAVQLMNQGLLWLADNLRISYGQCALTQLGRMFVRASAAYALRVEGRALPALDAETPISLRWPEWYAPDSSDMQRIANTVISLVDARQMSRETALRIIAGAYDIENVSAELKRIEEENT